MRVPYRASRHGLTLVELLVTTIVVTVIMVGVYNLLEASWSAYSAVVWQNTVDREARRALDDICDTVRSSGYDQDLTVVSQRYGSLSANLKNGSDSSLLIAAPPQLAAASYQYSLQPAAPTDPTSDNNLLVRDDGILPKMVAQYVQSIHFEYEYRNPAQNDPAWSFAVASNSSNQLELLFIVHTVYITVTASHQAYPNGPTYTRTLRSAVTLRKPYNAPVPLAQQNGS